MTVFISYARLDEEFVLRLANDLRKNKVSVWIDQLDIPLGSAWDTAIEEALETSSHFLLVISQTSRNSRNVLDEIAFAVEKEKTIITVLIDDSEPPLRVRRINFIDFRGNYDNALQQLVSILPSSETRDTTSLSLRDKVSSNPPSLLDVATSPHSPYVLLGHAAETCDDDDITGVWKGLTGTMELVCKDGVVTGDYDWKGHDRVGHIVGVLNQNVIKFQWNWDLSPERGNGFFIFSRGESPNEDRHLNGSWFMEYQKIDLDDVINNKLHPDLNNPWRYTKTSSTQE